MSSDESITAEAPGTFSGVTTLHICHNTVLHTGLKAVLSNTKFALADDVVDPTSDLSAVAGCEPVLFLLRESLSPDDSLDIVRQLKVQCPAARVVVLADLLNPTEILRLFEAGLSGLCSPAMARSSLVKALELVMAGGIFIPAAVGLAVLGQFLQSMPDAPAAEATPAAGIAGWLTDREVQILRCLMQGDSNKEIACQLDLSEATIKVHIKNILHKIPAANRTQAAMWARQHL